MKTIEIKQDGKVLGIRYLKPLGKILANRYDIHIDGKYYDIVDNPPFIYLDENGNEVMQDQPIWYVKTTDWSKLDLDPLWTVLEGKAVHEMRQDGKEHYKVFVTKEAADKFVSENRPFVTHDGVTVYKGHQLRCMDKSTSAYQGVVEYHKADSLRTDIFLWFSSMDAFNDYIKKKKLSLSLEMIENRMREQFNVNDPSIREVIQVITELVNEQFKIQ